KSNNTQCTHVPTGASGSSIIRAKLCVFAGGSFQFSLGETSGPSQVNFFGMVSPAEKALLPISNGIVFPFCCAKRIVATQNEKPSIRHRRVNAICLCMMEPLKESLRNYATALWLRQPVRSLDFGKKRLAPAAV